MSDRKKVAIAIVGSLVLHAVLILLFTEAQALWPRPAIPVKPPETASEEAPAELSLEDPPPQTPDRQFVHTNEDQKTDAAPKDAPFESDKDTAAASEKEATGKDPVPTQDGKEVPGLAMVNEDYSLDAQGRDFRRQLEEQPKPDAAAPTPTPMPSATPQPTPSATPEPTPTATPEPAASPEELAMLRPAPTPAATPPPETETRREKPPQPGAPPTRYRQQQIVRRLEGNISTRGRSSVAAVGTPQGRFQQAVQDAVGSRWYYYVQRRSDLINIGTVQISFAVTPDGRVERPHVVSNTSNETLANSSLQSILDAKIPPMPAELAPLVPGSGLEFTFSFNFM